MKIAIPSTGPTLESTIERRIGMAAYFIIIESKNMSIEVIERRPESNSPGAGVEALSEVLNRGAEVLIVDVIAPHIAEVIRSNGVTIVDRVQGPVQEALKTYLNTQQSTGLSSEKQTEQTMPWPQAVKKAAKQFTTLLPMLIGVILLLGLFQGFISQETLLSLFSKQTVKDSVLGALLGSVLAGNPVNSYVIGDGLLKAGVNLAAVTAFMLCWVSVGIIQLPAEAAALGMRFALIRAITGYIIAIFLSIIIAVCMGGIG